MIEEGKKKQIRCLKPFSVAWSRRTIGKNRTSSETSNKRLKRRAWGTLWPSTHMLSLHRSSLKMNTRAKRSKTNLKLTRKARSRPTPLVAVVRERVPVRLPRKESHLAFSMYKTVSLYRWNGAKLVVILIWPAWVNLASKPYSSSPMQASQMSVIARLYQLSLELCHQGHHAQAAHKD